MGEEIPRARFHARCKSDVSIMGAADLSLLHDVRRTVVGLQFPMHELEVVRCKQFDANILKKVADLEQG